MESLAEIFDDIVTRGGELLARIAVATVVALVIIGIGMLCRPLVQRGLQRQGRPSRTRVFTALYRVIVVLVGILLSVTLAFPSVRVVDVLASLGVISVAVGFAFKDVLENLLAGVLLLLRDPFKSGDQIRVAGYEGTVEGVTVRETLLKTFDGERVLIPNAHVYTGSLEVSTHFPTVRVSFRLALDAASEASRVHDVIVAALAGHGVEGEPAPEVVLTGADSGALEVQVRLWAPSDRASRTAAIDRAVPVVLHALREAGIQLDQPRTIIVRDGEE